MSYENHQLHTLDHGTIFLYTRNDTPIFHARVKVHGVSGYVKIASTQKRTASEAYAVAKSWYENALHASRQRKPTGERWTPQKTPFRRSGVLLKRPRAGSQP